MSLKFAFLGAWHSHAVMHVPCSRPFDSAQDRLAL